MIMVTTAEKVAASTTFGALPMLAKMRPTSPRGIIPTPMLSRSIFSSAPSPQICLQSMAAAVNPPARPRMVGHAEKRAVNSAFLHGGNSSRKLDYPRNSVDGRQLPLK
jgi:hypothetical protein